MSSDLAPRPSTALATPNSGPTLGSSDLRLPRVHLFQDVGKESRKYGKHPKGTFVLDTDNSALPAGSILVPVAVVYKWLRMAADNKTLLYKRVTTSNQAPPDVARDFSWGDNGEKPLGKKAMEMICITEACDLPVVVAFSSTGLKAGEQLNSTLTIYRKAAEIKSRRDPNVSPFVGFALESRIESNDKGEWYVPVPKPAGAVGRDTPLYAKVADMHEVFAELAAEVVSNQPEPGEDDDLPI